MTLAPIFAAPDHLLTPMVEEQFGIAWRTHRAAEIGVLPVPEPPRRDLHTTPTADEVAAYIAKAGPVQRSDICKALGMEMGTVDRRLGTLRKAGVLQTEVLPKNAGRLYRVLRK